MYDRLRAVLRQMMKLSSLKQKIIPMKKMRVKMRMKMRVKMGAKMRVTLRSHPVNWAAMKQFAQRKLISCNFLGNCAPAMVLCLCYSQALVRRLCSTPWVAVGGPVPERRSPAPWIPQETHALISS